mmetsp:Transcript_25639/g.36153  ORF Transcript_25639/g.36153 Transcript_25639/m.36153 type:complete len:224 (+) Transcript_25639:2186-2857(+)
MNCVDGSLSDVGKQGGSVSVEFRVRFWLPFVLFRRALAKAVASSFFSGPVESLATQFAVGWAFVNMIQAAVSRVGSVSCFRVAMILCRELWCMFLSETWLRNTGFPMSSDIRVLLAGVRRRFDGRVLSDPQQRLETFLEFSFETAGYLNPNKFLRVRNTTAHLFVPTTEVKDRVFQKSAELRQLPVVKVLLASLEVSRTNVELQVQVQWACETWAKVLNHKGR